VKRIVCVAALMTGVLLMPGIAAAASPARTVRADVPAVALRKAHRPAAPAFAKRGWECRARTTGEVDTFAAPAFIGALNMGTLDVPVGTRLHFDGRFLGSGRQGDEGWFYRLRVEPGMTNDYGDLLEAGFPHVWVIADGAPLKGFGFPICSLFLPVTEPGT